MTIRLNNYPKYGLLGEKQIFEFDSGANTRICFCIQEYFPFSKESQEKTDKFVKSNTYTSRSYAPSEVGGYYFVDNNIIAPQKKLGITASQWKRYRAITKRTLGNGALISRVEHVLKEVGLNYLIRTIK